MPVTAISGNAEKIKALRDAAKKSLVKHYPTLESLFGSLDFCECEHCRSVLSPAAYLVDLLRFLDPEPTSGTTSWPTGTPRTPEVRAWRRVRQAVRRARRAAARHPAICRSPARTRTRRCRTSTSSTRSSSTTSRTRATEAAHEYRRGHDRAAARRAAERRSRRPTRPAGARYPLGLPFDLWLETVRAFLARLEVPLWQLLETFRPTDELYPPGRRPEPVLPIAGLRGVARTLPAECALYTAGAAGSWWKLYGYASAGQAETALASAKTLARRLGVSYRELTGSSAPSSSTPGWPSWLYSRRRASGWTRCTRSRSTG